MERRHPRDPFNFTLTVPPPNAAPTAAHNTVTTNQDTAYTFTAANFSFADADTGDELDHVEIVTLPSPGSLTLGGTSVTANQDVTKADIDAARLVFTPVTGGSGSPYTTFDFKVSDGTAESASDYTMTVNVVRVNAAATGAPAIAGTVQVGMDLTASAGTIADADGLVGVTYSYQWIQVDGGTETDITGATGSTYTLLPADVGKTLKVRASFTDEAGFAESRTSAETATVAAASVATGIADASGAEGAAITFTVTLAAAAARGRDGELRDLGGGRRHGGAGGLHGGQRDPDLRGGRYPEDLHGVDAPGPHRRVRPRRSR